ncbi:Flp family type IVb pilin [Sphingobium yanoikuyae]|uniref:Flp family type IVb pilin n=1 Tax=Sphingobium yanoikuyae TaxID=13690 RepID=UPI0035C7825E
MRAIIEFVTKSALSRCERGATAVEYGLIIAMVVLAMIAALNNVATRTTSMWNNVSAEVTKH